MPLYKFLKDTKGNDLKPYDMFQFRNHPTQILLIRPNNRGWFTANRRYIDSIDVDGWTLTNTNTFDYLKQYKVKFIGNHHTPIWIDK